MQSLGLYKKYSEGKHWESHTTSYAESFTGFLKDIGFSDTLVDIGCGNGRDVNFFSNSGFDVLGIDNSEECIENCRRRFPELRFEIQDAENLRFEDSSIGAFFMINVIHYTDKEKAMEEVFRTLKQNGYFFIHFNMEIIDKSGNVDYKHDIEDILKLTSKFKTVKQRVFERVDKEPIEHKHKIIELVLQKQ